MEARAKEMKDNTLERHKDESKVRTLDKYETQAED